jgi:hypothetical protein
VRAEGAELCERVGPLEPLHLLRGEQLRAGGQALDQRQHGIGVVSCVRRRLNLADDRHSVRTNEQEIGPHPCFLRRLAVDARSARLS